MKLFVGYLRWCRGLMQPSPTSSGSACNWCACMLRAFSCTRRSPSGGAGESQRRLQQQLRPRRHLRQVQLPHQPQSLRLTASGDPRLSGPEMSLLPPAKV